MNVEGATSGAIGTTGIGSIGGVAVASAGSSMSAEHGTSGIGFDRGSPTFSGLGRSDTGLGSFSVNEGPIGPVSFTNSTDLFAETKSVAAIDEAIFNNSPSNFNGNVLMNTEVIATNPNLGSKPLLSAEPVSVLDNISPIQITMPVNEGPVPNFSFEDTVEIADLKTEISTQSEINVEDALESYLEISPETAAQTAMDLKNNDPLTYGQLKNDLESVDLILDLVDQVGADKQTITEISNSAIDTAVERSGLVQEIEPAVPDVQTDQAVDSSEEIKDQLPVPENSPNNSFVRDEDANKARIDNRHQTAEEVLKEADGEIVEGEDIIAKIAKTESEQSGLAKKIGVDDGSISPADEVIRKAQIKTIQEADNLIYQAVNDNSGVTEGISGTRATDGEKAKVAGKNLSSSLLV